MKNIYLIRHGETQHNLEGRTQGFEVDLPLNNLGKIQAKKTGLYFKTYRANTKIDLIIASPMIRARETAEIIAREIKYPINKIKLDDDIVELEKGIMSGTTHQERKMDKRFAGFFAAQEKVNRIVDPIARAESDLIEKALVKLGCEPKSEVLRKINNFTQTLRKLKCKNIIVVSHIGFLNRLIYDLCHMDPHGVPVPVGKLSDGNDANCTISYVTYDDEFILRTAPTNAHLSFIQLGGVGSIGGISGNEWK
jgi:broad specificity phosphatase PhoE